MRTCIPHPKAPPSGGFTLAELLVVVAIIGILFALTLPALVNITGGSKLDAAANAVHSAAKLARQYALTHNQPTYLVFNEGQIDPALAGRAYAVFTINTHTVPVTQDSGYFLTDWETLPTGVVFDDSTGGPNNVFLITNDEWNGAISKNNLLKIQNTDYVVHGFKPTGATGSQTRWIYLAEGFYNGGAGEHTSKQGKLIRFDITGKSRITAIRYDEYGNVVELTN